MSLTEKQNAEIHAVMDTYSTAFQENDIEGVMAVFSPEVRGFGSGADEDFIGHEALARQFKRDMSQAAVNAMKFTGIQIDGEGPVAWVMTLNSVDFTIPGSETHTIDGRSTMALRKISDRWLIEQIHFSVPSSVPEE
ncbi:nuclear transport factor 2 family protein [Methanolacinia paynteri]|uniref:nuclear transport factor 2 family protein n=1 Tax=Methanolacinia paynteri TaxID=230356 RepID=UPI00064FC1D9|nr:nuclear transport factor 2 family protein [Methanolacinia paynteri]